MVYQVRCAVHDVSFANLFPPSSTFRGLPMNRSILIIGLLTALGLAACAQTSDEPTKVVPVPGPAVAVPVPGPPVPVQGPPGPQGPQGPQGPTGDQGKPGDTGVIIVPEKKPDPNNPDNH